MFDSLFFKGLVLGFSIAAPVGPIGLLCIRRSLAYGRGHGLATGLGAATADAFYGAVAAFGLTAISDLLVSYQTYLQIFGGIFLAWLGVSIIRSKVEENVAKAEDASLWGSYLSCVVLTVSNPATILSFVAMFAAFNLGASNNDISAAGTIVGGVFIGSAAWWLILSSVAARFRHAITPKFRRGINYFSGAILIAFAAWAVLQAGW